MKIIAYGFVAHQNAYLKFVTLLFYIKLPNLEEFVNDGDFRNTWNILDFTIVMIGLVFNYLLFHHTQIPSVDSAFIEEYIIDQLFTKKFLSLFSSLLAVLQIQV